MHRFTKAVLVAAIVLLPTLAGAQSLSGIARDASGAVLPGVTVEASSPALIEKCARPRLTARGVSNENLTPGLYNVTFSLAGFTTVRREAVEVSGQQVITINADLRSVACRKRSRSPVRPPSWTSHRSPHAKVIDNDVVAVCRRRAVTQHLATVPASRRRADLRGEPGENFFPARGGRATKHGSDDGMTSARRQWRRRRRLRLRHCEPTEIQVTIAGGLGETDRGGPAFNMIPHRRQQLQRQYSQLRRRWSQGTISRRAAYVASPKCQA